MVALDLTDNPSQNGGRATSPKGARDMMENLERELREVKEEMARGLKELQKAKSHILRMDNQLKQAMSLLHESERLREEGEKKLAMFESDKSVDDILGSDLRPKEGV
jgi:septal ring factor EnvC (AmiA/AmiB activator)